tara:strand:- start:2587 stop:3393 length:807 start_codon:yes stop_codon:yes gene_type:complete
MGIRKIIKKKLCNYLLNKNIFTSKKTPNIKIKELISLVYPKKLSVENIRIGGKNDGGYIIPNDFNQIKYCFSPGVGNLSNFENDLAKKNIKSFLADYSVNPNFNNSHIDFEKKYLGPITDENYISLKDWMISKIDYEQTTDLILQVDIEGDEYDVLSSVDLNTLRKFRIILIEFHNLHYMFDEFFFQKIFKVFKLLSKNYYCSHIHPNNDVDFISKHKEIIIPPVLEFSFLRKDRAKILSNKLEFPNKLDNPNNPNKRDIVLPKCWHE